MNELKVADKKLKCLETLSKYMSYEKVWRGLLNRKIKTRVLTKDNLLKSEILLKRDELPVLEYFNNDFDFLVLTTSRLYYTSGSIFKLFKYSDIKSLDDENVDFNALKKGAEFIDLKLNLIDGSSVVLKVETGTPIKAVLLLIISNMEANDPGDAELA